MMAAAVLLVIVLVLGLYYPALSAGIVADDFVLVGRISLADALRYFHETFGFGRNEYRPLTALTFGVDHALWGDYAPGYHLTNLVLHALVAALLCLSVHALTGDLLVSFCSAVAFAAHPVNHSRVTWISARDATVASVFLLTALWLYVLSRRDARPRLQLLAIPAAICALLAYEGAVIIGALLLTVEWVFFSKGPLLARTVDALRRTAPFLGVVLVYIAVWHLTFSGRLGAYDLALDASSIAANYGSLLYTLFWGHRRFLIGIAYVVLIGLCLRTLIERRTVTLFAVSSAVISFVPFSFTNGFAHRFAYLSALGFSMILGVCFAAAFRMSGRTRRTAMVCVAIGLCVFYAVQVRKLVADWTAAGDLAARIPRALKQQHPELPEGAVLVFTGIPHSEGRAMVFPTGLEAAIQREYPVRLEIRNMPGPAREVRNSLGKELLLFDYVGGDELLRQVRE